MEQRMPPGQNQAVLKTESEHAHSQSPVDPAVPQEKAAAAEGTDNAALQRAEELVDHLGERAVHYAGLLSRGLRKVAARAREEVQDVWAEAQHISKRGRS